MAERRRVAVVGLGLVTPIGRGFAGFSEALMAGKPGGGPITLFDASKLRCRVAAEVENFDAASELDGPLAKRLTRFDRRTGFAVVATEEALADAGPIGDVDPERMAITLGTALTYPTLTDLATSMHPFVDPSGDFDGEGFGRRVAEHGVPFADRFLYDEVPRWIAERTGAQGGFAIDFAACAASAQAIGEAFRKIRRGTHDVCITGGFESVINPWAVSAFIRLGALTQHNRDPEGSSRPFDRKRSGFLMGEGAAVVVLEEWERAKANGRRIYGEIVGYGTSLDAARVTAPHPKGRGAVLCMGRALRDAGVGPGDVEYINAHGTGTKLNDAAESAAIHEVFGSYARSIAVSSSKSMFGHLLGAAGAIELAACMTAFGTGRLPPTINLDDPDPACDLDHVAHVAREAEVTVAMSNSFAFGGQNASLVLRHPEP